MMSKLPHRIEIGLDAQRKGFAAALCLLEPLLLDREVELARTEQLRHGEVVWVEVVDGQPTAELQCQDDSRGGKKGET